MIIRSDTQETRDLAAEIVKNGGLIAFRTDTFYGLGVDPLNRNAVNRIKRLKGREEGKPILLLISEITDADELVRSKPDLFWTLTQSLWPGPLTIVLPAASVLSEDITAETGTVGLRLPDDEDVRLLVRACGGALTATSANTSGNEPAKSALEVQTYFPIGIDLIVDRGDVNVTEPSTVIDIAHEQPRIIREGAVSRAELETVLGRLID